MNQPKLAVLIPTIEGREQFFDAIWNELNRQRFELSHPDDVVILVNKDDQSKTIGQKRNELMDAAVASGATHRAFVDDDDMVSANYIALNLPGVRGDFDCNSLLGKYYVDGVYDRPFHYSLKYADWWHDDAGYYRNPCHLNVIKIALIKHIRFHERSFDEDRCFGEDIAREGLLKSEYPISETVYHYYFRTKTKYEIKKLNSQMRPGS